MSSEQLKDQAIYFCSVVLTGQCYCRSFTKISGLVRTLLLYPVDYWPLTIFSAALLNKFHALKYFHSHDAIVGGRWS